MQTKKKLGRPFFPVLDRLISPFLGGEFPCFIPKNPPWFQRKDPLTSWDWSRSGVGFPTDRMLKASDAGLSGIQKIRIGILDSGMDYTHPDLVSAVARDSVHGTFLGRDFTQPSRLPYDVVYYDLKGCADDFVCLLGRGTEKFLVNPGHGTHLAGKIGATWRNHRGLAGFGIGSELVPLKFIQDYGSPHQGQGDDAAAIEAIDYAIRIGIQVLNLSWGERLPRADAERSLLKQALERASAAGMLLVAAAGNDGEVDLDRDESPVYPAAYSIPNLVTVASSNQEGQLSGFSNWGRHTVDVAAPGEKILSTTAGGGYNDLMARVVDPQVEMEWSGTSMAASVVSGVAAWIWSICSGAQATQIRLALKAGCLVQEGMGTKIACGGTLSAAQSLEWLKISGACRQH